MALRVGLTLPGAQHPPAILRALRAAGVETVPAGPNDEGLDVRVPLTAALAGTIELGRVVDQLPAPEAFREQVRAAARLIVAWLEELGRGRPRPAKTEARRMRTLHDRARQVVEECERLFPEVPG